MKEFKFRVLIDTLEEENAFRDIAIDSSFTFDKLHEAINEAFDFKGDQVASFYLSNEDWDKGQEIGLMDMTGESDDFVEMESTLISEKVEEMNQKLLYVYDFLSMWCFFVELVEINNLDSSKTYPVTELIYGNAPSEESKQIEMVDDLDFMLDEEDDLYGDIEDEFGSFENIDDYDL
jgi:hypothetical protein